MAKLVFFLKEHAAQLVSRRRGETKLGEVIKGISSIEDLPEVEAKFVVVGLPEDVGVKANFGLQGTSSAWNAGLKSFLNIQKNQFMKSSTISILGHFDFSEELDSARNLDPNNPQELIKLRKIVSEIDVYVSELLYQIFQAGKVPLIIGGGHNNCYPILKALSESHRDRVNVINVDAHADFRPMEGRHSGNGFRYAFENDLLEKYAVVGLHESYNSEEMLHEMGKFPDRIKRYFYEDIIREVSSFDRDFQNAMNFTKGNCGLEIDMDSISGTLSSAGSNSGFLLNQVREMIGLSRTIKLSYLHICESAEKMADGRQDPLCGKNISYLLSDFIKAQNHHHD